MSDNTKFALTLVAALLALFLLFPPAFYYVYAYWDYWLPPCARCARGDRP